MTNRTYTISGTNLIPSHGGYRKLLSYQTATLVYDLTVEFCNKFVAAMRMRDQMVQAARSGRQNIAEGCQASGTSKKTEIKLVGVARASLEELLIDYEDFLRQRGLPLWAKDSTEAKEVRMLAYRNDKSYKTYSSCLQNQAKAANTLICLIHQTNYLLDRQLKALEQQFLAQGGFTERLYNFRKKQRGC